jgi:hypothetical protein
MVDTCDSISPVYWVGWVIFVIITFACWVLGTHRGSPLRKINFHTVTVALWFVTAWYGAGGISSFCTIDSVNSPGLMDFSLTRILVFTTLSTACAIVITYHLDESTADVIVHVLASIASQVFLIVSIIIDRNRIYWSTYAVWFSFLLLLHMWVESRADHCSKPRFSSALLWTFAIYIIIHYTVIFSGPWFADIISLLAQEIILLISDILLGASVLYVIEHYGWAEKLSTKSFTKPGEISNSNKSQSTMIIEELHTIN